MNEDDGRNVENWLHNHAIEIVQGRANEFVQYLREIGFDLTQVKAALENGSWQAEAGMSPEEHADAYRSVLSLIAEVNRDTH